MRPFRRPDRREPTVIFPREIIASGEYLAEVEKNLARIADRPALIVWGAKDGGFRAADRERFERMFANHRRRAMLRWLRAPCASLLGACPPP